MYSSSHVWCTVSMGFHTIYNSILKSNFRNWHRFFSNRFQIDLTSSFLKSMFISSPDSLSSFSSWSALARTTCSPTVIACSGTWQEDGLLYWFRDQGLHYCLRYHQINKVLTRRQSCSFWRWKPDSVWP